MYQVADSQVVARGGRALIRQRVRGQVSRTVLLLGVVSMLTDISSEMVTTILPIYLIYTLGMSPLQFGVIDGIQQGASSLVRVASGFTADKFGKYKEVAALGYGISAFCRIGLLVVGRSWALIGATIFADRTGKGIRTAPRDALISLSTPEEDLGMAFGVHRALDTTGAMIGPLVAFTVLFVAPQGYHAIFMISFCFAIVGLAVLLLFVENRAGAPRRAARRTVARDRDSPAVLAARVRDADDRRVRALAGDDERRLHLPRPAGQAPLRGTQPAVAVRRHVGRLHAPRRPRRQARRPARTPAGVRDRVRPLARRLCRAGAPERRHGRDGRRRARARDLLRRDRRCPDGAREQHAARGLPRHRPLADRQRDQHRPVVRVDRIRCGRGRSSASTPRSSSSPGR